ncbi:DUF4252 domain-containing protein [Chryseobacterium foetidum]|uniref:DUF4252 domain-containing protein n=1 Tax=Chryseobacterium foetidum TaxID=2951057 RepID=UPI0021CA3663|nr:DUF2807 domain-containing protein [Chryseobacterium foetidum]
MKNIVLLIILFLGSFTTCTAQNEKIDQLFNDMQKKGVTSIEIKKPMFALLNSIDISDDYLGRIKPVIRDVDGLKLLVFSKITFPDHLKSENKGQIKMNEEKSERVSKLLSDLNLNELMSLKSDDVSMKFLAENAKNGIIENLIFNVDSKDEIVIFMLNGKMKMDDVNRIINSDEIQSSNPKKDSSGRVPLKISTMDEPRNVGNFSGIDVSNGIVVNFTQENSSSVRVFADIDKFYKVITKVENGILRIYLKIEKNETLNFRTLHVSVSAPVLEQIKASSGAVFNSVNTVNQEKMMFEITSGSVVNGNFNIDDRAVVDINSGAVINSQMNVNDLSIKSTSGSALNLNGNANLGTIDINSGAVCNAKDFKFKTLKVKATSGAVISSHVIGELSAKATSGGSIRYKGNPKIESGVNEILGGSLKQIN